MESPTRAAQARAGCNQGPESFLLDQPAHRNDARRFGADRGRLKPAQVEPVVNAMHFSRHGREALADVIGGEVAFRDDGHRAFQKHGQTNFEIARGENIVRVRGQAVIDPEKLADPIRSPCGHSREVGMHAIDSLLPQARPDKGGLRQPQEIRLPSPFLNRVARGRRQFSAPR